MTPTGIVILTAVLTSPVILAIVNKIMNYSFNRKTEYTLEEIHKSLEEYKIKQAIQDLRQKCWKIIETEEVRRYSNQEYYMLYNQLEQLLMRSEWPSDLQGEVSQAEEILREEKIKKER